MEITIKAKQFVFLLPNNPPKKGTPMKGFKKASIASVTAIAVAAGMCTPAFAEGTATPVGVKVKDNVCTIVLNKDDATLLGLKAQQEIKKDDAKTAKKELIKAFTKRETIIKGLDQQLKDKKVTEQKVKEEQDKFKKESVAYSSVAAAYQACADGKNFSETDYDLAGIFSTMEGKPNQVGIGVIAGGSVLVGLALIIALLPQIKPLLPAEIAAMLP